MHVITTTTRAEESFHAAMAAAGLMPPATIEPGRIVRFPGAGKSNGNRAGWAWLAPDGLGGAFGDWSSGLSETWHRARSNDSMTEDERAAHRQRIAELQRVREEEHRRRQAEAAEDAQRIWDRAEPAPPTHEYLERKQVHPHGLRISAEGRLLVPVMIDGRITSLQFIDDEGAKRFLPGGQIQGGLYAIGEIADTRAIIAEGFATAASIREATGCPVVVAFSAGNLLAVAQAIREQHPHVRIVLASDHDPHDVGQTKAREAAAAVEGVCLIPDRPGDWNDLAARDGPEAVRVAFESVVQSDPEPIPLDAFQPDVQGGAAPSWPSLDTAARHGVVGDLLDLLEPHTEADSVALLAAFLSEFGTMLGRAPHLVLDCAPHPLLLWIVLIGASSKARKGSSDNRVHAIHRAVDPDWWRGEMKGTLSSGEGLAYAVRDPMFEERPVKEGNRLTGETIRIQVDAGVTDKRLFLVQSEFGTVLRVMGRDGNSLSGVLRDAWDGKDLAPMTKQNRVRATAPHIGLVGHITTHELDKNLSETDSWNGFGNRFWWMLVRRSKELPFPAAPAPAQLDPIVRRIRAALQFGRTVGRIDLAADAREAWRAIYHDLSADRPGLVGSLLARAEAQVLRASALYALLDTERAINAVHLTAALALWQYNEDSVRHQFGDSTGDADADAILRALRQAEELTDTDISAMFGNNRSRGRLEQAKQVLLAAGLVTSILRKTGGRPVRAWRVKITSPPSMNEELS